MATGGDNSPSIDGPSASSTPIVSALLEVTKVGATDGRVAEVRAEDGGVTEVRAEDGGWPDVLEVVDVDADDSRVPDVAEVIDVDAGDSGVGGVEEDSVVREINVYMDRSFFNVHLDNPFSADKTKPLDKDKDTDTEVFLMQYPLRPLWRPFKERCEKIRLKPQSSEVEVTVKLDSENYDHEVTGNRKITHKVFSSLEVPNSAPYYVGVLKDDSLHLNRLDKVVQLRPSNSHMNASDSVSMIPSVKANDGSKDFVDRTEESEPWVSLDYHQAGSTMANDYLHWMKFSSALGNRIDFTMYKKLLSQPLVERLKTWFTKVYQVNQFALLKLLAPSSSEEDILEVLTDYAYLVQGLWVCKSSLLFSDDVEASKRDTILLEFTKNEFIPTRVVDRIIRAGDPLRKKVLPTLCKRRGNHRDYKFISAADESFLKCYPHVVVDQNDFWSALEKSITASKNMNISSKESKLIDVPTQNLSPWRSVLELVVKKRKVCSTEAVLRDIKALAGDASSIHHQTAKYWLNTPKATLKALIQSIADPVHDVYVSKIIAENSLGNILCKLFREKENGATLLKNEIYAKAQDRNVDVDDEELRKIITEICIDCGNGAFMLKSGD